jgi:fatty acid desaturase
MTALRMRARDFLDEDQLIAVRERVTWKGIALIAHAWALILGSIALVAWWPNPLIFLLAVGIIGSRQLGLAILMHDGAHGCLSADEKVNLTLSQWFCAYPIFAETRAYRRYHLQHHARTQQEDDPDLILSAPFPITGVSYRRKFFRDITGQTGYQQRKAQLLNALGPKDWPLRQRAAHFWEKLGPQCLVNGAMFAALTNCPAVTATPFSVSVPAVGSVVIFTFRSASAGESFGSVKPKLAALKTYAVSSLVVTVLFVPTGASFTDATLIVIVREVVSVSTPPLAVPPPSMTWNLNVV